MNDCPKYTALSYTWGNPTLSHQIFVNNRYLHVTESLEVALQHLRDQKDTLTLWIDAICINQQDTDEKNQQVQQMADIYRNASQVIVWLGPAANESVKVIEYLKLVAREYQEHGLSGISDFSLIEMLREGDHERHALITSSRIELFRKLDNLFHGTFPVMRFRDFAHRGWWRRTWVIQEICLAHEPVYLCGKERISGVHLKDSINFFSSYGAFQVQRITQMRSDEEIKRVYAEISPLIEKTPLKVMLWIRGKYQRSNLNSEKSLYTLVQQAYVDTGAVRIVASDERDLVFALLGLASDKDKLQIRLDYSKDYSVDEVYIETSKVLLTHGHLDLLSLRQVDAVNTSLPSWVCDWRREILSPFGDPTHLDKPFAASGNLPSQVVVYMADGQHIAAIQGLRVDEIEAIGCPWLGNSSNEFGMGTNWEAAQVFVEGTEIICGGRSDEEIVNVLLGGIEIYGTGDSRNPLPPRARRVTQEGLEGYKLAKKWLRIVKQFRDLQREIQDAQNHTMATFTRLLEKKRAMEEMSNVSEKHSFFNRMQKGNGFERRPFRSKRGYVGLAPQHAQLGDIICILFGSKVPHVVRPGQAGRYQLVGEAYVYGIMDGELMEGAARSMTFELY
jgi:chaperonin cofactor prefoldin